LGLVLVCVRIPLCLSSMYVQIFDCFFLYGYTDHRPLHSFPTRRSSDLRCVGQSRGVWRKSPISVTSLPEISHGNLQPYATASQRNQLCRWSPARQIFLCSGPGLWGEKRK